jgi:hypothetical protein
MSKFDGRGPAGWGCFSTCEFVPEQGTHCRYLVSEQSVALQFTCVTIITDAMVNVNFYRRRVCQTKSSFSKRVHQGVYTFLFVRVVFQHFTFLRFA